MPGRASSTIAALCYVNHTPLDFCTLVDDLGAALRDTPRGALEICPCDETFVVFDLPGLRICLDHSVVGSDTPDLAVAVDCAQAVMVSVGPGPGGDTPSPEELRDLQAQIAALVGMVTPYDHEIRFGLDGMVDEDRIDEIVEHAWLAALRREAETMPAPALPAPPRPTRRPEPRVTRLGPLPAEEILAKFDARAEAEQAAREAAWSVRAATYDSLDPGARRERAAWLTPRVHLKREGKPAPRIVVAKSAAFDGNPAAEPLVHRAAVNGLNATMIAFALPVGLALLTLALLGRESLSVSSRSTALAGAWMGITHADSLGWVLNYFS